MRSFRAVAVLFAALAPLVARTALASEAPPPIVFPAVSNNAALQYWQAFAMLPALDAQQEQLLDNRATAPLDGAATKILNDSRASLMFLTRGGKLRECDWGLDYHDGASMYLPHLNKARTLSRIAALEVRRAFEAGEYDRARDIAFGMIAMARQVGADRTMVSMLVSYMIEEMVVDAVAPYLPLVDAPYDHAVAMFQSLPPGAQVSQGVLAEKQMGAWIANELQAAEEKQPGAWRDTWKAMILGAESTDPIADLQTFDEVIEVLNNFQGLYDELAQLTELPPQEFDAKYPEFLARAKAVNPIAKILLPAMDKVMTAQRHSAARMAMLLAAIAVIEGGPEKLAAIQDPFGDGPFVYRKLDDGFELSSQLEQDGKPVTLTVGQKATAQ